MGGSSRQPLLLTTFRGRVTPRHQKRRERIKLEVDNLVARFDMPVKQAIYLAVGGSRNTPYELSRDHHFTDLQIGKIIKLGVLAEKKLTFFGREKMSIEKKRDLLRQAGFTAEEINRIPESVMQLTMGEKLGAAVGISMSVAIWTGIIYWLLW